MSVVEDSCPAPDVPEAVVEKQVEERNMLLKAACKQVCMNIDDIRIIKYQPTSIYTPSNLG